MVADNSQSMSVSWSPYGKILTNTKAGGASLAFGYNAMQQRVLKRVVLAGDTTRTYYIRDAQGNTMGVYTRHNDSVTWREQYIFGSSRLGLYRADTLVNKGLKLIEKLYEGKRNYELTNHLGNVMAVINDRKADTTIGVNKGYNAVVISATDYYPFGMSIDSRSYTSALYRYGFNGKETDKETGEQDYGERIYDSRLAKFLSIDPLATKYPELSPYQFASNRPIDGVDLDGREWNPYEKARQYYAEQLKEIFNGVGEGLDQLSHDLAWVRPATADDPKTLSESFMQLKQIPANLYKLPSNLKKVYSEGSTKDIVKTTISLVGVVTSLRKGGPKLGAVQCALGVGIDVSKLRSINLVRKFFTQELEIDKLQNSIKYSVKDGKFSFEGIKTDQVYTFIIDEAGQLKLGESNKIGHFDLAGGKKAIKGAGQVTFDAEGKIKTFNNNSGHYTPSFEDAKNTFNALKKEGFLSKDAVNESVDFSKGVLPPRKFT